MAYRFATENKDYSDFASGRVFYAAPGHPALPVRLVSEVFQRCQAIRQKAGLTHPVTIYDPCCGSAYHLSTLAYLHWSEIDTIIGSDIDGDILRVAERNLRLLTPTGLEKRTQEITDLFNQYGKDSHAEAIKSAQKFKHELDAFQQTKPIVPQLFVADATNQAEIVMGLGGMAIDIVLTDVPYGNRSAWQSSGEKSGLKETMLGQMLHALLPVLHPDSVVAIVADKAQKGSHPAYKKMGRFRIGKRQIVLLQVG